MQICAKPPCYYLLERLRIALEDPADIARVKLMVVDEAWRYLKDPAVLSYLAEAAKTWRKRNAALIMATQSAGDVTQTPEAAGLLESMPTKIFLANPNLPRKGSGRYSGSIQTKWRRSDRLFRRWNSTSGAPASRGLDV